MGHPAGATRPESGRIMLLTTKLSPPPLRPNRVPRPHLLERLEAGLRQGSRLTLISAPAGYGKTSLVAEWVESCGLKVDPGHLAELAGSPGCPVRCGALPRPPPKTIAAAQTRNWGSCGRFAPARPPVSLILPSPDFWGGVGGTKIMRIYFSNGKPAFSHSTIPPFKFHTLV
jgi:hypothetical protein